ncbi:MAG TPA: hypothetical protein VFS16_01110 [Acidimicrobiia bacterium]|nr:hypothetical protein [Acidimicrobiia bacterium]
MDRYTYVERPFDAVWAWLGGHLSTLGHPLEGGGRSVELRIHPAGREISRPVRLHVSGMVCDGRRATAAIGWADAAHPRLFPELNAVLEVRPVPNDEAAFTQLGIAARYRPPLGALGAIGDRLVGADVTDAALTTLLEELARAAEQGVEPLAPAPFEAGERGPELDDPALRRLFLTVDGLGVRPGGAAEAAGRLEAVPGVAHVSLNPLAGLAVVDHDPARCGLDLMRAVFEDGEGAEPPR